MSSEVARKAVRLLVDYSRDAPLLNVTFFGGEPLLQMPLVEEITDYAAEQFGRVGKQAKVDVTTNGTLIDDDVARSLSQRKIGVLVSVDGLEETHNRHRRDAVGRGTFERVARGIENLLRHGVELAARVTVMPSEAGQTSANVRGLASLGLTHFIVALVDTVEWTDEQLKRFFKELERLHEWCSQQQHARITIDCFRQADTRPRLGCGAARHTLAVTPDGSLWPCSRVMGVTDHAPALRLGDVDYGITHLKNRLAFVIPVKLRAGCKDHLGGRPLLGHCYASNMAESGDAFRPSLWYQNFSEELQKLKLRWSGQEREGLAPSQRGESLCGEGRRSGANGGRR